MVTVEIEPYFEEGTIIEEVFEETHVDNIAYAEYYMVGDRTVHGPAHQHCIVLGQFLSVLAQEVLAVVC